MHLRKEALHGGRNYGHISRSKIGQNFITFLVMRRQGLRNVFHGSTRVLEVVGDSGATPNKFYQRKLLNCRKVSLKMFFKRGILKQFLKFTEKYL